MIKTKAIYVVIGLIIIAVSIFAYNKNYNDNLASQNNSDQKMAQKEALENQNEAMEENKNNDENKIEEENEAMEENDFGETKTNEEGVNNEQPTGPPEVDEEQNNTGENNNQEEEPEPTPTPAEDPPAPIEDEEESENESDPVIPEDYDCDQFSSFSGKFLCLLNTYRTSNGLNALSYNSSLNAVAQGHSDWMDDNNTFSHTGENDSSMVDRCEMQNTSCDAENLASGANSAEMLLSMWQKSSLHDGNMLGEHTVLGFGQSGKYITVVFQ